jgi:hypothetical protein
MDVRAIKHAAKLSEWQERIQACRTSGIPVKTWCEKNNISIKSYYRWERLYMAEASNRAGNEALLPESAGQLVRIDPDQLPDKEGTIAPVTAAEVRTNNRITLRYGSMSLEMPAGIGITEIAALMKALEQPC